jgi:hypothetical protein
MHAFLERLGIEERVSKAFRAVDSASAHIACSN